MWPWGTHALPGAGLTPGCCGESGENLCHLTLQGNASQRELYHGLQPGLAAGRGAGGPLYHCLPGQQLLSCWGGAGTEGPHIQSETSGFAA